MFITEAQLTPREEALPPLSTSLALYADYWQGAQAAGGLGPTDTLVAPVVETAQKITGEIYENPQANASLIVEAGRHGHTITTSEALSLMGLTHYIFYVRGKSGVLVPAYRKVDEHTYHDELYLFPSQRKALTAQGTFSVDPLQQAALSPAMIGSTPHYIEEIIAQDGQAAARVDTTKLLTANGHSPVQAYDEFPWLSGYDASIFDDDPHSRWRMRARRHDSSLILNIYDAVQGRRILAAQSDFNTALTTGNMGHACEILQGHKDMWPELDARAPHTDINHLVGALCKSGKAHQAILAVEDYCTRFKQYSNDPRFKGLEADLFYKIATTTNSRAAATFAEIAYRHALDMSPVDATGAYLYPNAADKWQVRLWRMEKQPISSSFTTNTPAVRLGTPLTLDRRQRTL